MKASIDGAGGRGGVSVGDREEGKTQEATGVGVDVDSERYEVACGC